MPYLVITREVYDNLDRLIFGVEDPKHPTSFLEPNTVAVWIDPDLLATMEWSRLGWDETVEEVIRRYLELKSN
jgi:hypothetical protein